jgi:hypothetical protein
MIVVVCLSTDAFALLIMEKYTIEAPTTQPTSSATTVTRVMLGFFILSNDRTERRGRSSASALPTDVARPRSLQ